jgi:hypothetical protein
MLIRPTPGIRRIPATRLTRASPLTLAPALIPAAPLTRVPQLTLAPPPIRAPPTPAEAATRAAADSGPAPLH